MTEVDPAVIVSGVCDFFPKKPREMSNGNLTVISNNRSSHNTVIVFTPFERNSPYFERYTFVKISVDLRSKTEISVEPIPAVARGQTRRILCY